MNKNGILGLAALFLAVLILAATLQTPAKDQTVGPIIQAEVTHMVNMVGVGLALTMIYTGFMWDLVIAHLGWIFAGLLLFPVGLFCFAWVSGIFKSEPEEPAL